MTTRIIYFRYVTLDMSISDSRVYSERSRLNNATGFNSSHIRLIYTRTAIDIEDSLTVSIMPQSGNDVSYSSNDSPMLHSQQQQRPSASNGGVSSQFMTNADVRTATKGNGVNGDRSSDEDAYQRKMDTIMGIIPSSTDRPSIAFVRRMFCVVHCCAYFENVAPCMFSRMPIYKR